MAWRATQAVDDISLPTCEFALGGVATAGAVFWYRFNPHGLGMVLKVHTGGLVLAIGRPNIPFRDRKPCSYDCYGVFGSNELLLEFSDTASTHKAWMTEKVYLGPSTEL